MNTFKHVKQLSWLVLIAMGLFIISCASDTTGSDGDSPAPVIPSDIPVFFGDNNNVINLVYGDPSGRDSLQGETNENYYFLVTNQNYKFFNATGASAGIDVLFLTTGQPGDTGEISVPNTTGVGTYTVNVTVNYTTNTTARAVDANMENITFPVTINIAPYSIFNLLGQGQEAVAQEVFSTLVDVTNFTFTTNQTAAGVSLDLENVRAQLSRLAQGQLEWPAGTSITIQGGGDWVPTLNLQSVGVNDDSAEPGDGNLIFDLGDLSSNDPDLYTIPVTLTGMDNFTNAVTGSIGLCLTNSSNTSDNVCN